MIYSNKYNVNTTMDNEWADFVENQKKEYKKNHPEK